MKKIKLNPHGIQKSFYGKAKIEDWGFIKILISYKTAVAYIDKNNKLHRLWDDYSVTTMNHIKAFCMEYGIEYGGKKWWTELKVEKLPMKNYNKSSVFDMEEYRAKQRERWCYQMYYG